MIDINKTINEYITLFNEILNDTSFNKSIYVSDLKQEAIKYISDNYRDLNIISPYTNGKEFEFSYEGLIKHELCDLEYKITFYFKISTKRTDEIVAISKLQNRYLNYIDKNPVKYNCCKIKYYMPSYKLRSDLKIEECGCTSERFDKIKVKKENTIQNIIDKIVNEVNSDSFINSIKCSICQDIVKKAMLNKNFYNNINFGRFINDNGQFKFKELYQFIIDNNMLVKEEN